ncbi:WD40 repeat-like protein [Zopfia rhizophila CBS 207.26]|uniref:WD40 repeat-like protein n=1 Tax=Zopfia rhizophila CBS 207.26 TaxID=1314779 RepID=A0A6A6DGE7_9PEZI|nr:WD40 repeat-like protein [Zopfia rhizophila CBS 207.26]
MGGLLIKRALLNAKEQDSPIWPATVGIMFMGVPHQGSSAADYMTLLTSIAKIATPFTDIKLKELRANSDDLLELSNRFGSIQKKLRIISVLESERTAMPGVVRGSALVVPKASAMLNIGEEYYSISGADHHTVCKFSSAEDPQYLQIATSLQNMAEDVSQQVSEDDAAREAARHERLSKFFDDICQGDPANDMTRIRNRKGDLLEVCYAWVFDDPQLKSWRNNKNTRLLWIKGNPGKGKTMLMIGLVNRLTDQIRGQKSCALSFFFCEKGESRLDTAISVLRGLIWKLLWNYRFLYKYIPDEYASKHDDRGAAIFEGANAFSILSTMLSAMLLDSGLDTIYILVDALDELKEDEDSARLIEWIAKDASTPRSKAKWLISSRYTTQIEETFREKGPRRNLSLEMNHENVSHAVDLFIDLKVADLADKRKYDPELREQVKTLLKEKCESTFLWVSLVCQMLKDKRVARWNTLSELQNFPSGLEDLYQRMLEQVKGEEKSCTNILRVTTVTYRPLRLEELVSIADLPRISMAELCDMIQMCGSFLLLREDTVYFVHLSAKEYLHTNVNLFEGGNEEEHRGVVSRSLKAMSLALRNDIYDLKVPGCLINEVEPHDPDPLVSIRYSCVYWVDHLSEMNSSHDEVGLCDDGEIDAFLKRHLLHWLEALSLMKSISSAFIAIRKLGSVIAKYPNNTVQLRLLIHDASRFILYNRGIIEKAPLQVYSAVLLFSPSSSIVKKLFRNEIPPWIDRCPRVEEYWSPCLQVLEHPDSVSHVAYSHDGRLATYSCDKTVRIWDVETGELQQSIQDDSFSEWSQALSMAFSPDGLLATHVSRNTKFWDTKTGKLQRILQEERFFSIKTRINADILKAATESNDYKMDLFNGRVLKRNATTDGEGYEEFASVAAYSPNGRLVAATFGKQTELGARDTQTTMGIWEIQTGVLQQTMQVVKQHIGVDDNPVDVYLGFTSVAISPDNRLVASGSRAVEDYILRIWDIKTGRVQHALSGHSSIIGSLDFSPDSRRIASSGDHTARIWDIENVNWQDNLDYQPPTLGIVVLSSDGRKLASTSTNTVWFWDTDTGAVRQKHEIDGVVLDIRELYQEGRMVTCHFPDQVQLWDPETGEGLQYKNTSFSCFGVPTFSRDGQLAAFGTREQTVIIVDAKTKTVVQTLEGHTDNVFPVAFSYDGQRLASSGAEKDKTVRIWNVESGALEQTLTGHTEVVTSLTFSQSGRRLASISEDGTIRIWNAETGALQQALDIGSTTLSSLSFGLDECSLILDEFGCIALSSPSLTESSTASPITEKPIWKGYRMHDDLPWVTWNGIKVLWLPPEFRPTEPRGFCSKNHTVAVGCSSGHVICIKFNPDISPI